MRQYNMQELVAVIEAVHPLENGFQFREKNYVINANSNESERYIALFNMLTPVLYSECYAKKRAYQVAGDSVYPSALAGTLANEADYLSVLSANNFTTGIADSGWTVTGLLDGGHIQITKNGAKKVLKPGEYIAGAQGVLPGINELISFQTKKEELQPAFYYVYSNAYFDYNPTIIRFYWNVSPAGATEVVSGITRYLNHYQVPFLFKCLRDPAAFTRRDCCVLYLQSQYLRLVLSLLPQINEQVKPHLGNDVPLFSYELEPGVGLAESPANGDSFGMHRMKMVASGILNAFHQNKTATADKLQLITDIFAMNDVAINTPFLNEKSFTRTLDVCTENK